MEQPTKKFYIKRNSPKAESRTASHQWYMHNVPEYKINSTNYLKTKSICDCGCVISNRNMATHQKSYKHDVLLAQKNNNNINNNLIAV